MSKRYIDADKAVEYFEKHRRIAIHKDDIVAYLSNLHTADVQEVRHGRWTRIGRYRFGCSECSFEHNWRTANYCPNCGAKMDLED